MTDKQRGRIAGGPGQLRGSTRAGGGSDGPRVTRMDAHVHSSASDGPAVAALGFIGCPESYSEPEKVFDQARARGMDLVALTDHDTIGGAMSLVERGFEGIVVGQEVTTHFPEDRCKLHVLVWGLTPEQDEQIGALGLREDVYQFAEWLKDQQLAHALAHPLYVQNGRLDLWHLERCALIFKGFETLNGAHTVSHRKALDRFLDSLTPRRLLELTDKHGFEPIWPRAWEKTRTGGSDDHALLNIGRTWTQIRTEDGRRITDPGEFIRRMMRCECEPGGVGGHPSLLAHQLTSVGAHYFSRRVRTRRATNRFLRAHLLRFAGIRERRPPMVSVLADLARRRVTRRRRPPPLARALRRAALPVLDRHPELRRRLDPRSWDEGTALSAHEEMERFSAELIRAVSELLSSGTLEAIRSGDRRATAEHVLSQAVVQAGQLPYVFSLFHQNKERWLVDRIDQEASGTGAARRPLKVMLFTDTLGDVNGVSRFITTMADQARAGGRDFTVCTSTNMAFEERPNVRNFAPLAACKMPGYGHLELVLPPMLEMLRAVDREQPDVIHVSTPGPVGVVGRIAAKMVRAPVVGVYHTDFPAYVERLFDDHIMTDLSEAYMKLFYSRFARVLTRSTAYIDKVIELGMSERCVEPLAAGCDTQLFTPARRDETIWPSLGASRSTVKVLYCGRVSVEKNLPVLARIWPEVRRRARQAEVDAELIVVGDGPYRAEMESQLAGEGARFIGYRYGHELATLYASSDCFVFPSTTDTLGQVVMEAQSCGLPALVSDVGGPPEIIRDAETGYIASVDRTDLWIDRLVELIRDGNRRREMGAAGRALMEPRSVSGTFRQFWSVHERVFAQHLWSNDIPAPKPSGRASAAAPGQARHASSRRELDSDSPALAGFEDAPDE